MLKRKHEDAKEWKERKHVILRLYLHEDQPLKKVIRWMGHHGFKRTKAQYERAFKDWKITKNVKEEEWKYILSHVDKRKALGKQSAVTVRGALISQARIEKQKSRQRQSMYDYHVALHQPSSATKRLLDIDISTPRPTSDCDIEATSTSPVESIDPPLSLRGLEGDISQPPDQLTALSDPPRLQPLNSPMFPLGLVHTNRSADSPQTTARLTVDQMKGPMKDLCLRSSTLAKFLDTLRHAVLHGLLYLVEIMLSEGTELVEAVKKEPWSILEAAATLKDARMINFLLGKGLCIRETSAEGSGSVIAVAAKQRNTDLIKHLLNENANIDGAAYGLEGLSDPITPFSIFHDKLGDISHLTALMIAVKSNDQRLARFLLYHGADPDQKCRYDLSTIDIAASMPMSQRGLYRMLTEAGPIVTTSHVKFGSGLFSRKYRPSFWLEVVYDFIVDDNFWQVKQLLKELNAIPVQNSARQGSKALVVAARRHRTNIVNMFLDAGYNPFERPSLSVATVDLDLRMGAVQVSPFEIAVRQVMGRRIDLVKSIIEWPTQHLGKDERSDRSHQLYFAYATALRQDDKELIEVMTESDIKLDQVDKITGLKLIQEELYTVLQDACSDEDFCGVDRLLANGANPNAPDGQTRGLLGGDSPLRLAVLHGQTDIVQKLLKAGAHVNTKENNYKYSLSLLHVAVWKDNLRMVDLLLQAHADANILSAGDEKVIEFAARRGVLNILCRLLRGGATIFDKYGYRFRIAQYLAKENGHEEVLREAVDDIYGWGTYNTMMTKWPPIRDSSELASIKEQRKLDERISPADMPSAWTYG